MRRKYTIIFAVKISWYEDFRCVVPDLLGKLNFCTIKARHTYFQIEWFEIGFCVVGVDFIWWINDIEISVIKMFLTLFIDRYAYYVIEACCFHQDIYCTWNNEDETEKGAAVWWMPCFAFMVNSRIIVKYGQRGHLVHDGAKLAPI